MDFKFAVFGSKMGLWPWKVGRGRWKWVSVIRSTRGPYLYMLHVCPIDFVRKKERKKNNKNDKNNSLHHCNGEPNKLI